MQAVWEADTSAFRSRKRVARACSTCQKRKKKCYHTFAQDKSGKIEGLQESSGPQSLEDGPLLKHVDTVRFVGDLNPESVLSDFSERPKGSTRQSRVGVWIEAKNDEAQDLPSIADEDRAQFTSPSSRSRSSRVQPRHAHLLHFLQDAGAFTILPLASQQFLVKLYVSHVHPFLPLIDVESFLPSFERGEASNFLVLAISLTASKSSEAAPYLRWETEGPVVPARIFARRLCDGLHFAINTCQETDPLINIQILGLLALHNDGPQGLEKASMHLCQAIHHAHTLGLHIDSSRKFPGNRQTERLFWSLWCLDKLNACTAGRPVKIFDEDIGISRPTDLHESEQLLFGQQLALCDLLAVIIDYYRPTADQDSTGWEEGFPTLEEIRGSMNDLLNPELTVIIELLYRVAAIIACRAGTVGTKSYIRREAAANEVELILRSNPSVHLSPLPIASYAASLSMTVAYRMVRDNLSNGSWPAHLPSLAHRCDILETFKDRWWSAEAMTRLGRKALSNIHDMSRMQQHEQKVASGRTHDVEISNPLEMLSSVAESHAHGGVANGLSQTLTLAAEPEAIIVTEGASLETQIQTNGGDITADMDATLSPLRDLDTAFGDFFDLSMPTTFFDPLFDEIGAFDFSALPA